jgi:RNA polymerase sigma-70 factor (ECF subfamily)
MQPLRTILKRVRHILQPEHPPGVTDSQLLDRFLSQRDEAAFELLVWRHGPMVLGVCRRVLQDAHDAEDAFQATFLTLARKGDSIGRRESLGGWLYTVAQRIALRARARQARRTSRERPLPPFMVEEAACDPSEMLAWRELRPLLDAEVARLPEKYRDAFVLCYIEGKTNEEAAEQLGCPKGTILSRLSRARERLRKRLSSRGVLLAAAPFALLLVRHARTLAEVSPALVQGTAGMAALIAAGKASLAALPLAVLELADEAVTGLAGSASRFIPLALGGLVFLGMGAGVYAYSTRPLAPCHGCHSGGSTVTSPGPTVPGVQH